MSLNADQRLKLELILEGSREFPDELNGWETGFVSSMSERYESYKDEILISEKQWGVLDKIYDKVMVMGEPK